MGVPNQHITTSTSPTKEGEVKPCTEVRKYLGAGWETIKLNQLFGDKENSKIIKVKSTDENEGNVSNNKAKCVVSTQGRGPVEPAEGSDPPIHRTSNCEIQVKLSIH